MIDQDFDELGEAFTGHTMLVGVGQQVDLAGTDPTRGRLPTGDRKTRDRIADCSERPLSGS